MGLQEDPTYELSTCVGDVNEIYTFFTNANSLLTFDVYKAATVNDARTPTDWGYVVNIY